MVLHQGKENQNTTKSCEKRTDDGIRAIPRNLLVWVSSVAGITS